MASCSSCVKEESQPAATGSQEQGLTPGGNKVKIVDKRMHPRIGEEGGFLVPFEAGTD